MPMRVTFLGVGEACDERLPNTSLWVQTGVGDRRQSVLMDCGFTAPSLYWQQQRDPNDLDALWISHFHGDHFFGVPALLLRFWEMRRSKALEIVSQNGVERAVAQAMELAYPGFFQKLTYPVLFHEVEPGQKVRIVGLEWSTAQSIHGQKNLAVRVAHGEQSIFYSGDGLFTPETIALARACNLVVHESFQLDPVIPGHGTVRQCIDFAREAGAAVLALVHVQRDERRDRRQDILRLIQGIGELRVVLPEPGDTLEM
jgi:ribonuclease BN (tRNA processing enzyme)